MKVNIKLIEDGKMPVKMHETDAGFDCYARKIEKIGNQFKYWLGFAIEIPVGYIGLVFPRSSVYKTGMLLTNCIGVVDPGFTGEVGAIYLPLDTEKEIYSVDDRVVQLIIIKNTEVELNLVDNLSDSDRGEGGYGSTGNK